MFQINGLIKTVFGSSSGNKNNTCCALPNQALKLTELAEVR